MVFKSNDNCSHEFLDAGQYQKNGILRYERIFGETFVSTGGETTTKVRISIMVELCNKNHITPIVHRSKI